MKRLLIGASLIFAGVLFSHQANALTPPPSGSVDCFQISESTTIPNGYGSPFNVFSSEKKAIVRTKCTNDAVTVEAGDGTENSYVYKMGHRWNGSKWVAFDFAGTKRSGNWIVGGGSATLEVPQSSMGNNNYVVAYVCTKVGNSWKCGCRNEACTTNNWQLQIFKRAVPPVNPLIELTASKSSITANEQFTVTLNNRSLSGISYSHQSGCFVDFQRNDGQSWVSVMGPGVHDCAFSVLESNKVHAQTYVLSDMVGQGGSIPHGTYRAVYSGNGSKIYSNTFTVTGGSVAQAATLTVSKSAVAIDEAFTVTVKNTGSTTLSYIPPNHCGGLTYQKKQTDGTWVDKNPTSWSMIGAPCGGAAASIAVGASKSFPAGISADQGTGTFRLGFTFANAAKIYSPAFTVSQGTGSSTVTLTANDYTGVTPGQVLKFTAKNTGSSAVWFGDTSAVCSIKLERKISGTWVNVWPETNTPCTAIATSLAPGATHTANVTMSMDMTPGDYRGVFSFDGKKSYSPTIQYGYAE